MVVRLEGGWEGVAAAGLQPLPRPAMESCSIACCGGAAGAPTHQQILCGELWPTQVAQVQLCAGHGQGRRRGVPVVLALWVSVCAPHSLAQGLALLPRLPASKALGEVMARSTTSSMPAASSATPAVCTRWRLSAQTPLRHARRGIARSPRLRG